MIRKVSIILFFACLSHVVMAQEAPLYQSEQYSVYPRKVVEGDNHADIVADNALTSTIGPKKWIQKKTQNSYPLFSSDVPVSNTLYNLSVEELTNLWGTDKAWHSSPIRDVANTRDLGYATLLSLALMDAEAAQSSLMERVKDGKIMQDNGTGGAWPVTTDRAVWVLGAWEVYLATGDKMWLQRCYEIVRHSLEQDEQIIYNPSTGLVRGELSLPNCRKEVYPSWMQPTDISLSECLSTNALFFRANEIAARMAALCGDKTSSNHYQAIANSIKKAINDYLWIDEKGYYGQFLYGRMSHTLSPRSETMGEAMCILFGIADEQRAKRIVRTMPTTPYGTPCFSPQIPNVYYYHNNAVWPYIQAYWTWAVATTRNPLAIVQSIAALYRPTALMATNKESTLATTGGYSTVANAGNSLLSIAANASIPLRILAGISLDEEGISFNPIVPKAWTNKKQLNNVKYRKAVLDISIQGHGDRVKAFYIDGKKQKDALLPASTTGHHSIRLVMNNDFSNYDNYTLLPAVFAPETPRAWLDGTSRMAWQQSTGAKEYKVLRNGSTIAIQPESLTGTNFYDIPDEDGYAEYQVIAVDEEGNESFASEPLAHFDLKYSRTFDMAQYATPSTFDKCKGYGCSGAVEITTTLNTQININIDVPADGEYAVDFRYANGNGSPVSGDQCVSRMLWANGKQAGCVVFPQRGKDIWTDWGYSTPVRVHLKKGPQTLVLIYELNNETQGDSRAILDHMRLTPILVE
ncbi:MAG: hypothetical protein IKN11_09280 [Bacteroidales bacterium]|nr:hypothetical protein [Bacteroidales bacterium]